jgi:hypothetical protein
VKMARTRPEGYRQVLGLVIYLAGSCLVWHLAASRTTGSIPSDALVLAQVQGACQLRRSCPTSPRASSRVRGREGGNGRDGECADLSDACTHASVVRQTLLGRLGPGALRRFPLAEQPASWITLRSCMSDTLEHACRRGGFEWKEETCTTAAASEADCEKLDLQFDVHSSTGPHARSGARAGESPWYAGRVWGAPVARLRGGADDAFFEGYNALKPDDFGENGHIYQIEYALEAVKHGLTVVAVKGEKCLAFAVERRVLSKLQTGTMRKIHQVDAHVVATATGLAADALPIINRARVEALTFRLEYEDCASIEYMARYIADVMLQCSLDKEKRPYGCSILVTGLDLLTGSLVVKDPKPYPVPRIFVCDPSGAFKVHILQILARDKMQ